MNIKPFFKTKAVHNGKIVLEITMALHYHLQNYYNAGLT